MSAIEFGKTRLYFFLAAVISLFLVYNFFPYERDLEQPISGISESPPKPYFPSEPSLSSNEDETWDIPLPSFANPTTPIPSPTVEPTIPDEHPINRLIQQADERWRDYEGSRSETFRQAVTRYRSKYGRHPPPGFQEWYKFARMRNAWNVDDFDQIMDDLRPFWAIEPSILRTHAAYMWENPDHAIGTIHIREGKVVKIDQECPKSKTMSEMFHNFVQYLPDMDIAMNKLDTPRVVMNWTNLQRHLAAEVQSRVILPEIVDSFTSNQTRLTKLDSNHSDDDTKYDSEWFAATGTQYMTIAKDACPPESPMNSRIPVEEANDMFKEVLGGIVKDGNRSTDLCTVGPAVQDKHGMLFAANRVLATQKLVPVFSDSKLSVNNDILFPGVLYYRHEEAYDYSEEEDVLWHEKSNETFWRGDNSGGVQTRIFWQNMQRQRLVQFTNATSLGDQEVRILAQDPSNAETISYKNFLQFKPSLFAASAFNTSFVELKDCVPDCAFYDDVFSIEPKSNAAPRFQSKFLLDVDGNSYSGQWYSILQSRSLGLKATILREWHDSRLFAWRHFIPLDIRYDDLYSVVTYLLGYQSEDLDVQIRSHQDEAKQMARQGREWATKILRRDDMEIYMFRLLLEYGRVIDDNRDRIGYSGDGSELDQFDQERLQHFEPLNESEESLPVSTFEEAESEAKG